MRTKYKQVKVNFKEEDFYLLDDIAKSENMTKAEYIRKKIGDFSLDKTRERKGEVTSADAKLIYEIAKIGTNLNQISKHCNINKKTDTEILKLLVSVESELKRILP